MPANPVAFVQTRASRGLQCQPSEGDAWAPIRQYWRHPTSENREILREALSPAGLRSQYTDGVPDPNVIAPEGYTLDAAMIDRPGNMDIQLDLFLDLRQQRKTLPGFSGVLPQIAAAAARNLGKARLVLCSARRKGLLA
jgi:hypothetical protein